MINSQTNRDFTSVMIFATSSSEKPVLSQCGL